MKIWSLEKAVLTIRCQLKKRVKGEASDCLSTNHHAWVHHPWECMRLTVIAVRQEKQNGNLIHFNLICENLSFLAMRLRESGTMASHGR